MNYAVINQPAGIGDIFFLQKGIDSIISNGWNVVWPVNKHFSYLNDYIKKDNLTFYNIEDDYPFKEDIDFKKNIPIEFIKNDNIVKYIPLDHAQHINGISFMKAKYALLGISSEDWKNSFIFSRNENRENKLKQKYNIEDGQDFIFVNNIFASPPDTIIRDMEISSNMKVIYNNGEPCHIFDYCWIIENAKELHLVESAFCYLVEKLNTTDKLFMYSRKIHGRPQHQNFDYVSHIYKKNWNKIL